MSTITKQEKAYLRALRCACMDAKTPEGDRMASKITDMLLGDETKRKPRKQAPPAKSGFGVEIIDADGRSTVYGSARDAFNATNIPIASIYKFIRYGGTVSRGQYEGYQFRKINPAPTLFAVYQGEEILATGTVEECAKTLDVKPDTIRWMAQPVAKRRLGERKRSKSRYAIRVEG